MDLETQPGTEAREGYTLNGVDYDWLGYVVETETGPKCGHCGHRHASAAAIFECHRIGWEQEETARAEYAAEMAYERHLEDRGYWDTVAEEQHYLSMGIRA